MEKLFTNMNNQNAFRGVGAGEEFDILGPRESTFSDYRADYVFDGYVPLPSLPQAADKNHQRPRLVLKYLGNLGLPKTPTGGGTLVQSVADFYESIQSGLWAAAEGDQGQSEIGMYCADCHDRNTYPPKVAELLGRLTMVTIDHAPKRDKGKSHQGKLDDDVDRSGNQRSILIFSSKLIP